MLKLYILLLVFIISSDAICGRERESQKLIDESAHQALTVRPHSYQAHFNECDDTCLRSLAQQGLKEAQDELVRRWSEGLVEIEPSRDLKDLQIDLLPTEKFKKKLNICTYLLHIIIAFTKT